MNYSVTNLNDVADCDITLSWAAKEQAGLNFKKISDEYNTERFATTSQELEAELQGVLVELSANEMVLATLPEGKTKEDALDKKTRLEFKKFLLLSRKDSYGVVALLQKEFDLESVTQELGEMEVFIAAIEARKTELENAA